MVKPVITALDTKLIAEPSFSSPKTDITSPTRITSVAMLPGSCGSSPACCSTLCEDRPIALVRVVTISTVRANSDPMIVGTTPE